jgi:hypothetical protein
MTKAITFFLGFAVSWIGEIGEGGAVAIANEFVHRRKRMATAKRGMYFIRVVQYMGSPSFFIFS